MNEENVEEIVGLELPLEVERYIVVSYYSGHLPFLSIYNIYEQAIQANSESNIIYKIKIPIRKSDKLQI